MLKVMCCPPSKKGLTKEDYDAIMALISFKMELKKYRRENKCKK